MQGEQYANYAENKGVGVVRFESVNQYANTDGKDKQRNQYSAAVELLFAGLLLAFCVPVLFQWRTSRKKNRKTGQPALELPGSTCGPPNSRPRSVRTAQ